MGVGFGTHFRSPVGPNRSVLIFSRRLPAILRRSATVSTKPVGPQTEKVALRFAGQVTLAIRSRSTRPGGRGQSFGTARVEAQFTVTYSVGTGPAAWHKKE